MQGLQSLIKQSRVRQGMSVHQPKQNKPCQRVYYWVTPGRFHVHPAFLCLHPDEKAPVFLTPGIAHCQAASSLIQVHKW